MARWAGASTVTIQLLPSKGVSAYEIRRDCPIRRLHRHVSVRSGQVPVERGRACQRVPVVNNGTRVGWVADTQPFRNTSVTGADGGSIRGSPRAGAVSYTHLTLPTKRI